jgi:uroporphyrinogen decarboxylase
MNATAMTSMQRTLTALGQKEPDQVPMFLLTTLHGAKELNLSIQDYFSSADHVAEGQMRLHQKYRSDCLYAFFHASIETEAWGGSTHYLPDGPPLCGAPVIQRPEDIDTLQTPPIAATGPLGKVLSAIRDMKRRVGDTVPIVGVTISPFSLPAMQMGFHAYLELIYEQPARFEKLMQANEAFTVAWANAQLEAGATAICYFDPVASTTIVPRALYQRTGMRVAQRTIAQIKGPTATHLASGRGLPIVEDLISTGTAVICVSAQEDLAQWKQATAGRINLLGNLNGVEMRRWMPQEAEEHVKNAIAKAGRGGGFILGDHHGEIPWQVSEEVLLAIGDAVQRWGRYPLNWIADHACP